MWKKWEDLPDFMQIDEVKPYWESLDRKKKQIAIKRIADAVFAGFMIVPLSVPMLAISVVIKLDSEGPIFFRQERVTAYGKRFRIHKFRTMTADAEESGNNVTSGSDERITAIGAVLRKYKLDEIPQLIDVLRGDMSFVGTRPEVVSYVEQYKPEYYATLLMPAGITSETSIRYMDEEMLLDSSDDVERCYIEIILPEKMRLNLRSLNNFSLAADTRTLLATIQAVLKRERDI